MVTVVWFLIVQGLLIVPEMSIVLGLVTALEVVTVQGMQTIQSMVSAQCPGIVTLLKYVLLHLTTLHGIKLCCYCHFSFANWNRQAGMQVDKRTDKPIYWEACASKNRCGDLWWVLDGTLVVCFGPNLNHA